MDQEWFEMRKVRRRYFSKAVWVPLRASQIVESIGKFGHLGHREEFFGAGSLAIPSDQKTKAEKLTWDDVGIGFDHTGYVQNETYTPADEYEHYGGNFRGLHLVLEQRGNRAEHNQWHLHQDLAITLRLKSPVGQPAYDGQGPTAG